MQVKEYGYCVANKVPAVERDMCLKEFLALKTCMQNVVRLKSVFLEVGPKFAYTLKFEFSDCNLCAAEKKRQIILRI